MNGRKVGHSAEVKARMDEYTAINNGDAANHLHGASAAVKQSAASTATSFRQKAPPKSLSPEAGSAQP